MANKIVSPKAGEFWTIFWEDIKSPKGYSARPVYIYDVKGSKVLCVYVTSKPPRDFTKVGRDGKTYQVYPGEIQIKDYNKYGFTKPSVVRCSRLESKPFSVLGNKISEASTQMRKLLDGNIEGSVKELVDRGVYDKGYLTMLKEDLNLDEEIKVNDTLNPDLWDDDNEMKEDVKDKLLDIVDNFLDNLKEDKINIEVVDVRVVGSSANYNYTDKSDIDLHIVADIDSLPCEQHVLSQLYNAYKSIFNSKYDIKIKGHDVEIYVEDVNQPAKSNGIYSLYTGWIKKPKREEVPEIDYEKFNKEFEDLEDDYFDLMDDLEAQGIGAMEFPLDESLEEMLLKESDALGNALSHYFGERRKVVSNVSGSGINKGTTHNDLDVHHQDSKHGKIDKDAKITISHGVHSGLTSGRTGDIKKRFVELFGDELKDKETKELVVSIINYICDTESTTMYGQRVKNNEANYTKSKELVDKVNIILQTIEDEFSYVKEESFQEKVNKPILEGNLIYRGEGAKTNIPKNLSQLAGKFYAKSAEDCLYYASDKNHIYAYNLKDGARIYKARVSTEVGNGNWNTNNYKELEELTTEIESEYWDNIICDTIQEFLELGEQDDYAYEDTFEFYSVRNWMHQVVNRVELEKQGYDGIYYSDEDDVPQYQIWNDNAVDRIGSVDGLELEDGLNESLSQQVDSEGNPLTKEQVEFFKDSKVRDKNGNLLVVYHGTSEEFDSFSSDFFSGGGLFGDGFYFTPRQELAKDYGKNIKKCYLNITNPFNYYGWDDDELFKLLDAYGNYDKEKLEKIDYYFNYDLDLLDNILEPVLGFDPYNSFKEKLEECGYDGLIADEEIVAFNPNQIKSIDNDSPSSSNNINEAKAITWGDLDYGKKTDTRRMMGGRGTGHFGTGFYFVGAEGPYGLEGNRYFDYAPNRPIYEIDLDAYNLFKPKDNGTAYKIHDNMKVINDCYREGRLDSTPKGETKDLLGLLRIIDEEAYEQSYERDDLSDEEAEKEFQRLYREMAYNFVKENDLDPYIYYETEHFINGSKAGKIEHELQQAIERKQDTLEDLNRAVNNLSKLLNVDKNKLVDIIKNAKDGEDTISTQIFKALGYEGVDNTHLNKDADGFSGLDNFSYGTVIYDLKPGTYKKIKEPRGESPYGFKEGK